MVAALSGILMLFDAVMKPARAMTFPAGTPLTVFAMLGDSEVALPGRVVAVSAGSGFGFAIDVAQIEKSAQERLEAYIKEKST